MYESSIEQKNPAWESNGYRLSSPKMVRAKKIIDKCRDKFSFVALFWTIHAQPLPPPHEQFWTHIFIIFPKFQGIQHLSRLCSKKVTEGQLMISVLNLWNPGCQVCTLGARGFFFLLFAAKIEQWSRNRDKPEKKFFPLVTVKKNPLAPRVPSMLISLKKVTAANLG